MKKLLSLLACCLLVFGVMTGKGIEVKAEEDSANGEKQITPESEYEKIIGDNLKWWKIMVSTNETEILDAISKLPTTEVGCIGFDHYDESTYLSNSVLEKMKEKGLSLYTDINSYDSNVFKHFQIPNIENVNLNSFSPYYDVFVNNDEINKAFGVSRSLGVEFEYQEAFPGEAYINVTFEGNLFNSEADRDVAINVFQLNQDGEVVSEFKGSVHYMPYTNMTNVVFSAEQGGAYLISDEKLNPSSSTEESETPPANTTTTNANKIGVNTKDTTNPGMLLTMLVLSGVAIYTFQRKSQKSHS